MWPRKYDGIIFTQWAICVVRSVWKCEALYRSLRLPAPRLRSIDVFNFSQSMAVVVVAVVVRFSGWIMNSRRLSRLVCMPECKCACSRSFPICGRRLFVSYTRRLSVRRIEFLKGFAWHMWVSVGTEWVHTAYCTWAACGTSAIHTGTAAHMRADIAFLTLILDLCTYWATRLRRWIHHFHFQSVTLLAYFRSKTGIRVCDCHGFRVVVLRIDGDTGTAIRLHPMAKPYDFDFGIIQKRSQLARFFPPLFGCCLWWIVKRRLFAIYQRV